MSCSRTQHTDAGVRIVNLCIQNPTFCPHFQYASYYLHIISSPCYKEVRCSVHQTLVRSELEHAAKAWTTYNIAIADHLDHIHCTAARFVLLDYRRITSLDNHINILGWDHLHTGGLFPQLTMFHKIHYRLVNIHIAQLILPATSIGKHDHQLQYAIPLATIDNYKISLYPRSIRF